MVTILDLDKLDTLNDQMIAAIKDAKFSADFEIYLRTQHAAFMGQLVDDYNNTKSGCH